MLRISQPPYWLLFSAWAIFETIRFGLGSPDVPFIGLLILITEIHFCLCSVYPLYIYKCVNRFAM